MLGDFVVLVLALGLQAWSMPGSCFYWRVARRLVAIEVPDDVRKLAFALGTTMYACFLVMMFTS